MTLGTNDKKKTGVLAVLLLGAAYGVYTNLTDTSGSPAPAPVKHRAAAAALASVTGSYVDVP